SRSRPLGAVNTSRTERTAADSPTAGVRESRVTSSTVIAGMVPPRLRQPHTSEHYSSGRAAGLAFRSRVRDGAPDGQHRPQPEETTDVTRLPVEGGSLRRRESPERGHFDPHRRSIAAMPPGAD